jgi:hypothetical protein
MEILLLIINTAFSTLTGIGRIALILVPVIILIELARHYKIIEKITGKVKGALAFLTLPQEAAFPLLGGMFFGIVLGSALIIDYAKEGYLNKRDLLLIGIFLSISHSVIEDTVIFSIFGANPLVLIVTRTILAIIITRGAAVIIDRFILVETKVKPCKPGNQEKQQPPL